MPLLFLNWFPLRLEPGDGRIALPVAAGSDQGPSEALPGGFKAEGVALGSEFGVQGAGVWLRFSG